MDKNNVRNIDIDDDEVVSELIPPKNILKMGNAADDDMRIYIKQDVYTAIEKFSDTNAKKEVGGALVGKSGTIGGFPAVIIDGYIEAKHTDSTKSTLTFTPETWAYLYGEREKRFADKQIVGWHRTHPCDGATLSNYDMYIVENFFNTEYSVTFVIDPESSQKAFYGLKKGRTVKMKGFNMYDDNGKIITAGRQQNPPVQRRPAPVSQKKSSHIPVFVTLAVIVLLLIANLVAAISTNIKFDKLIEVTENGTASSAQIKAIEKLTSAVEGLAVIAPEDVKENTTDIQNPEQTTGNDTQHQMPENGEDVTPPPVVETTPEPDDTKPTVNVPEQPENNDNEIEPSIPEVTNPPENQNVIDGQEYFEYTVQPGEYISLICDKFGINYEQYADDIVRVSGIANPDSIEIGQIIKLPKLN